MMRNQIIEQEKAQNLCSTLSKSVKGFEKCLQAYQSVPLNPNELITYVVTQANNANISLISCMAEPVVDHGWYQMQPMIIDVQGPLGSIVQWLKTISGKTKLLSVPSIAITKIDQSCVRCSATISSMCIRTVS